LANFEETEHEGAFRAHAWRLRSPDYRKKIGKMPMPQKIN
jgi:hypothetical protein